MSKVSQKITLVCNTEMLVQKNHLKLLFILVKIIRERKNSLSAFPAHCRQGLWLYLELRRMPCAYLLYKVGIHVYILLYKVTGLSKENEPFLMS
jgi:hypothetical protein